MALFVTAAAFAFKTADNSGNVIETEWYSLTISPTSDPEDAGDQMITGTLSAEPTGDCDVDNQGDPCAVHLESPNPLPLNISVEEALTQYGASFVEDEEESYAREPQQDQ